MTANNSAFTAVEDDTNILQSQTILVDKARTCFLGDCRTICEDATSAFKEWAKSLFSRPTSSREDQPLVRQEDRMFAFKAWTSSSKCGDCKREHLEAQYVLPDMKQKHRVSLSSLSIYERLLAVARDRVWKVLTLRSCSSHVDWIRWEMMRTRLLHIGALRLSLADGRPIEHGLEMPNCGSEVANQAAGVFRSEDEVGDETCRIRRFV